MIKNFIQGITSVFPIGASTIICYSYAIGNTTGKQLFLFMLLLFVFCAYMLYKVYKPVKQEQGKPEKPQEIKEPETICYTDPEQEEKRQAAQKEIESIAELITQYMELYDATEQALNNAYKEINRIRLQEKLINIEMKIQKLEQKRDKAYYILHN